MTRIDIPEPKIDASALVAPGARVYGDVQLDARAFLLFGVVVRAEFDRIVIGAETNIQDNTVVHCDEGVPCLIGRRVTVGHSAVVHGAEVGDYCLVGIGAKLLNRSKLGEGAWLAAGSVLTEGSEVPPWTLAIGAPARPTRELTEAEVEQAADGVEHYLALADRYRALLGEPKSPE